MLYLEDQSDPVVLDAVDQIENLTTSLSRKIWQKVSIMNDIDVDGDTRRRRTKKKSRWGNLTPQVESGFASFQSSHF